MKKLRDGFTYFQSKKDLRENGNLTEEMYVFLDEIKRSCAFHFYDGNCRFVITASYANADKTSPEFFISDLVKRKREQVDSLEYAKEEVIKRNAFNF